MNFLACACTHAVTGSVKSEFRRLMRMQQQPPPKRRTTLRTLLDCADLVLPYLPPRDLASAALACRPLGLLASSVIARRTLDAARGLEPHPVPFLNDNVDRNLYSYFLYSPSPLPGSHSIGFPQSWGGPTSSSSTSAGVTTSWPSFLETRKGGGCEGCDGCSRASGCPCAWMGVETGADVATECGEACACGEACGNRATQRGLAVEVAVVRDERKGWGLRVRESVSKGTFVCEYSGEFLTTEEARRRQQTYDSLTKCTKFSPALLVVREHLPSGKACLRVNIDATRIGNVARFINHSCDGGNLSSVLVRNTGSVLPRLCFFAASDIEKGEELTFSYGETRIRSDGIPCFCGSTECQGTLPLEET